MIGGFPIASTPIGGFGGATPVVDVATDTRIYVALQVIPEGESTWRDITDDVLQDPALTLFYGVEGNDPLALVAGTGTCQFNLRNDARPGKLLGRYSPLHSNCIAGWTQGIPFRVLFTYLGTQRTKFRGKVHGILPDSGPKGRRQVAVTAYDCIRDLAETDLRQIDIQIGKSETEVLQAIFDATPTEAQPTALDIDIGIDVFKYALYDLGSETKVLTAIAKVARSSFMFVASKGDGTLIARNRQTHANGVTQITFNGDMQDIEVPSDLEGIVKVARATTHPLTVGIVPVPLYEITGPVPSISPGQTFTHWGTYTDANNAQRIMGGFGFMDPGPDERSPILEAGVDYVGNAAADGSGANLTANLVVTVTAFATSAKFEVTNTGSQTVWLTDALGEPILRLRGIAVRDLGPQTFESETGTKGKPFAMDLDYQDNPNVGQGLADYVRAQRSSLAHQLNNIYFLANRSQAKTLAALAAEPGDQTTVSEEMTGLVLTQGIIQSVSLDFAEGVLWCKWGLSPAAPFQTWQVEIVGRSEVEESMIVGV